jgi:hypothetical protein
MGVTYMDARSAKLAIELLLEDVNSQLEGLYDDPPEGDALSSLEAMKAGLCEQLQVLEGSVAALDILKGEYINRLTFKKLLDEEKQAVADHQLAMELGGLKVGDPKLQSCAEYKASLCGDKEYNDEEEQWQLAKKVYAFETDSGVKSVEEVKDPTPQNGIQIAKSKQVGFYPEPKAGSPELERRCNACMESFPAKETLSLRCAPEPHIYCRGCLINLFQTAIVDTSLFPPRCCRATIPLDMCRALLPKQMIHDFDSKVEELATPNPTNCSDPDCSKFIRLANISNNKAKCACGRITCVLCKEMDHSGKDCPEDPHVKLLMDVAKRSKWQKCGKCKTLVELASGCYHMK